MRGASEFNSSIFEWPAPCPRVMSNTYSRSNLRAPAYVILWPQAEREIEHVRLLFAIEIFN